MSAPVTAPLATVAPAAANSASGMPDLVPAPGSTAISAPSAFIFLTVSGVAATRSSPASSSRATAMRIHPSPGERRRTSGRASATRGERQREQRDHHHHPARRPYTAHETLGGHAYSDQHDQEGDEPVAGHRADRQSQHDIDDGRAAHNHEMDEALVHRFVRRK